LSVEEIHLPRAPLVHVVSQIMFPMQLELRSEEGLAKVASALADSYPVVHPERVQKVFFDTTAPFQQPPTGEVIWRLEDSDRQWQVTIGSTFVGLDTSAYISRADFCARFTEVVNAIAANVNPPSVERLGIRYIDRIDDPEQINHLASLVRPELLGGIGVPLDSSARLEHSVSQSVFALDDHHLLVKWAVLPANQTPDPIVPAVDRVSWILDVDCITQEVFSFDPDAILAKVGSFAEEVYKFFRWAVTEDLIESAGGTGT
jgi:uncharacterized protein (TIGR04255 family)